MENLKKRIGEEEYLLLEKIIRREIDIRNLSETSGFRAEHEAEVRRRTIKLLQEWINEVYKLDHLDTVVPEFSLAGMFVTKEE